jgi:uncharacterized protein (TIGR02246 family)
MRRIIHDRRWIGFAALMTVVCIFAAGNFASSAAFGAAPPADHASLEAQILRLESEAEIRHLLVEYGRALDTRDLVAYSQLFTKDGVWSGRLGSAQGPEAILALMQKSFKDSPYDPKNVKSLHLDTNFLIHVQGDKATALSRWTVFNKGPDNKLFSGASGHYDDTLVRVDGRWRFQVRTVTTDIPTQPAPK